VVNHRTETLPNGNTRTVALSDEEIARVTSLVREAMGFTEARGDSLNVSSAPFAAVKSEPEVDLPVWKDPSMIELAKELIKYVVLFGAIAFVYLGVIRPLMRSVTTREQTMHAPTEGGDEEGYEGDVRINLTTGQREPTFEEKLARTKELAKSDPKLVANLVKEWLGSKEDGKK
jgi:flagellar M-ring protein FliF